MNNGERPATARRRYRWPWFLLAAVVVGFLLALLWLQPVIRNIREERQMNPPSAPAEPGR